MGNYEQLRELLGRVEERLERPVTLHISNGLVGFKGFVKNDPLNTEILLSSEDNATYPELVGALLRCVAQLEAGVPEYRESSCEPVDAELARRAAALRAELGI